MQGLTAASTSGCARDRAEARAAAIDANQTSISRAEDRADAGGAAALHEEQRDQDDQRQRHDERA